MSDVNVFPYSQARENGTARGLTVESNGIRFHAEQSLEELRDLRDQIDDMLEDQENG